MRAATISGSPTSAVPAPPRTRPTPAQRLGLISSLSRRPPCSCAMRCWPTKSIREKIFCAEATVSSVTCWISSSAAFQASALVSRTITCRRMPNESLRPRAGGGRPHPLDLLGDLRRRLAPGQIFVDGIDGDIDAGIRRSAEIKRRPRRLHRLEQQAAVLDADVLALDIDGLAGKQVAIDVEELARHRVALVMGEEDAVALVLDGVAAGDDVDQQPSVRHPVQRRRHARGDARRLQAGPAPRPDSAAARSTAPPPRRRPRNPRSFARSAAARRNSRVDPRPARSGADN